MVHELICTWTSKSGIADPLGQLTLVAATGGWDKSLFHRLNEWPLRQLRKLTACASGTTEFVNQVPVQFGKRQCHLVIKGIAKPTPEGADWSAVIHTLIVENIRDFPAGPAALLADESVWMDAWDSFTDNPQVLSNRRIESHPLSPRICGTWSKHCRDAGWAGLALEALQRAKGFALIVPPELPISEVLQMYVEVQSLLEPRHRWNIPISIPFGLPEKWERRTWTAFSAGTSEARLAARSADRLTLDISKKHETASNSFSEIARAGAWARIEKTVEGRESLGTGQASATEATASEVPRDERALRTRGQKMTDQKPLTSKFPKTHPNSPTRDFQMNRKLIRAIVGVTILGILATGGLYAYQFIHNLNIVVGAANSTPPATVNASDNASIPEEQIEKPRIVIPDDPDELANRPKRPNTPATISSEAVHRVMEEIETKYLHLELPRTKSSEPQVVLEIPGNFELAEQMSFGLALPDRFIDLALRRHPTARESVVSLEIADPFNSEFAKAEIRIQPFESEKYRVTRLTWQWLDEPAKTISSQLATGALLINHASNSQRMVLIPLVGPNMGAPSPVSQVLVEGIPFTPHLPELLLTPSSGLQFDWLANPLHFATTVKTSKSTNAWLPPHSSGNESNFFVLSEKWLEGEVSSRLGQDVHPDTTDAIHRLVQQISPVRVEFRLNVVDQLPTRERGPLVKGFLIVSMRISDGSSNSMIFQVENPEKLRNSKELSNRYRLSLANWLTRGMELAPSTAEMLFSEVPDLDRVSHLDQRIQGELVSTLFVALAQTLEQSIDIRVDRRTTLQGRSAKVVRDIPAFQTR